MPYQLPAIAADFPNVAGPTFWDQAASGVVDTATVFSPANLVACQADRIETLDGEWFGEWYGTGAAGTQIVGGSVLLVPKGGQVTLTELYVHDQQFEPLGATGVVFFGPSGERTQFGSVPLPNGVSQLVEVETIDDPALGAGLAGFSAVSVQAFSTPFVCTGILLSGYSTSVRTRRVFGLYTPDIGPRAPFWEAFVKSREFVRA